MKKLVFTCAVLSLALFGCKKDKKEEAAPAATTTTTTPTTTPAPAANVAASGEMWFTSGGVVYKTPSGMAGTGCAYTAGTGFQINGTFIGDKMQSLGIRIQTATQDIALGTYALGVANYPAVAGTCSAYLQPDMKLNKNLYGTDAANVGTLTITKYSATMVSGTFSFTGLQYDEKLKPLTGTMEITEGSFTDVPIK